MKKSLVLVINCGSSSLKFSLMEPNSGEEVFNGIAQCLLLNNASISFKMNGEKQELSLKAPFDHDVAISALVAFINNNHLFHQITAIGHRVVHGGEKYCHPTLITPKVKQQVHKLAKLAPLHNPANLVGIEAAEKVFGHLAQVAIFDTAFHQTMPEKAYIYGLPYSLYKEHGIRRYGFHGTSHYFVAKQASIHLNKPLEQCNLISAHLGNGCSISVIADGKSVDTSLGFTPLEGVVMGTRSGDVDPGIIFYLVNQLGYSLDQVDNLLNKESGLLGISGLSNDCRTIEAELLSGNVRAKLAIDVFCYRIAKKIASFSASLQTLDGLIFTGGIGENSSTIRGLILNQLSLLGFTVDEQLNLEKRFGQQGNINSTNSRACWVIPTNEEWVIAEQTQRLLTSIGE
ncbi:acetate/propionate family kinase [Thalassotalea piscium]|uniref:Acetate kinase n=1 Tax=Thalassotalea piscium TaxID=1230533 RepID=A0A7X0TTI2_9GAMM|nr:acetate kinase [Thalassotalea piscium]MBB6543178.1 acetate kinase [Thalassotalea piscium]